MEQAKERIVVLQNNPTPCQHELNINGQVYCDEVKTLCWLQ